MQRKTLVSALILAAAAVAVAGFLLLRRGSEGVPEPRTTIERALDTFVRERFGTQYSGTCLQEVPPDGDIPRGLCSARFSATSRRAVYGVGYPFSEWAGEATLVRDASGSWRVASFEEYPPLDGDWAGPPPPDESGVISVTEFTEYQDSADPAWADSPARIALEFLDLGDPSEPDQGAFTTTLIQEANPEGGEEAEVTVTLEGLLDDSVQATRYLLMFQKSADGAWRLASATWAQRCAPGRGHQDFSPELCI